MCQVFSGAAVAEGVASGEEEGDVAGEEDSVAGTLGGAAAAAAAATTRRTEGLAAVWGLVPMMTD